MRFLELGLRLLEIASGLRWILRVHTRLAARLAPRAEARISRASSLPFHRALPPPLPPQVPYLGGWTLRLPFVPRLANFLACKLPRRPVRGRTHDYVCCWDEQCDLLEYERQLKERRAAAAEPPADWVPTLTLA